MRTDKSVLLQWLVVGAVSFGVLLQAPPLGARPDLAAWDALLAAAVADNRVDYGRWADDPRFDALVAQVAEADIAAILGGNAFLPDSAIALQLMSWSIPIGWINYFVAFAVSFQAIMRPRNSA